MILVFLARAKMRALVEQWSLVPALFPRDESTSQLDEAAIFHMSNINSGQSPALSASDQTISANVSALCVLPLPEAISQATAAYAAHDWKRAEMLCRAVLAARPDDFDSLQLLGTIAAQTQRAEEGAKLLARAAASRPTSATVHNNLGNVLCELEKWDEALTSLERAISLNPLFAEAHLNRGTVLRKLMRPEAAMASYDRALELRPDDAEAHYNRGNALKDLGCLEAAIESYDHALQIEPGHAGARVNKGFALLTTGDFARGWELYESRRSSKLLSQAAQLPLWGRSRIRERVLVCAEQGLGDEVMFASMLPEFRELCATLDVQADPRLMALFSRSFPPDIRFIPRGQAIDWRSYDSYIPLGSLGQYLRNGDDSFPGARSFLRDEGHRTQYFRRLLRAAAPGGKRLCGISWRSKNKATGVERSMELFELVRGLDTDEFVLVNLQYGDSASERAATLAETGVDVVTLDEVDIFNDVDGLASLVQACDVVVSISNATVHLAGALGKDTRVLLPQIPGWRWQRDRGDSPWYPSVRLYRQEVRGDWEGPLSRVRRDLSMEVARTPPID